MGGEVIRYWAGRERLFRLSLGPIMDLEEALAKQAIGVTFQKLASGQFSVMDVHETLRIGLIGGGESVIDAKRLINAHFDKIGLSDSAGIASDLLASLMVGVEEPEQKSEGDTPERIKFSELSQISRVFNMSPQDVRNLRYSDYVNMMRGYDASRPDAPMDHLSEDEFLSILDKYEPKEGA